MVLARILWMLGRTLEEADVGGEVRDSNGVACTGIWKAKLVPDSIKRRASNRTWNAAAVLCGWRLSLLGCMQQAPVRNVRWLPTRSRKLNPQGRRSVPLSAQRC